MKVYKVFWDSSDSRFPYYNHMIVSSFEEWKNKVKEKIYEHKEEWKKYFFENEHYENSHRKEDKDFDDWVDFHITFDSYCIEIIVDNYKNKEGE